MALCTGRSDRRFCEQLDFNTGVVGQARSAADEPLIEALASLTSFRRTDEKPEVRDPPDDSGNRTVNFTAKSGPMSRTNPRRTRGETGTQEGQGVEDERLGPRPDGES